MKNGTALVLCKCVHPQQDALYGSQVRVANTTSTQDKDFVDVRCTVCNTIHRVKPERVR